ncbi:MAG: T9SS type A sorting domain-containing protein [Flavobacteriales bacterium]|nr:T9SS type A sorting domain-containing protein [Flavobacteriales bacterium]MBP6696549.1 T9SS type A sorting domain-containing protein [Flavobacteriales bacterium]
MLRASYPWVIGLSVFAFHANAQPPTYIWAKMLPGNVESIQRGTAVDATGNGYLYGNFWGTMDFDPGVGTVNVTPPIYGTSTYIAKYDANGNHLWSKYIPLVTYANAMVIDGAANIYICGSYQGTNVDFDPGAGVAYLTSSAGSTDVFMAKYDVNGNFIWAKSIGSTAGDVANDVQVDGSGNVYLLGNYTGTVDFDPGAPTCNRTAMGGADGFMAKYDPNGNMLWANSIGSTGVEDFREAAVNATSISFTGYYNLTADFDAGAGTANLISAGGYDAFVAKYDLNGNHLWSKSFSGPGNDLGVALTMDAAGNVFFTGSMNFGNLMSNGSIDMDPGAGTALLSPAAWQTSVFMARLDASGNYVWAKKLPLNAPDVDIQLDVYGRLYIAGDYITGTSPIDMDPGAGVANLTVVGGGFTPLYNHVLARFDVSGLYQWAGVFGHSCWCNVSGYKASLLTTPNGSLYFTGIMQAGFGSGTVDFDPSAAVANITAPSSVDNVFFAKYNDVPISLPVELLDFRGQNEDGIHHLFWTTASEHDNDRFEVERSADGVSFETLGSVPGAGNSQVQRDYAFDDREPLDGVNYYCLKQVDFDGQYVHSPVIVLQNVRPAADCTISTIDPLGVFSFNCAVGQNATLEIHSADGRLLSAQRIQGGTNEHIDLTAFRSGTYLVRVVDADAARTYKLVRE